MAIQILPKEETFASRLGTGLGGSVGNLLEGLVSGKVKELKSQQLEKSGLPGILSSLEPQVQAAFLKNFGAEQQKTQQQQQEQDFQGLLEETLGGPKPEGVEPEVPVSQEAAPILRTPESTLARNIEKIDARLGDPRLSTSQKARLREQREKFDDKLDKKIPKLEAATKDFFSKTVKEANAASKNNQRLDRMKTLIASGKITNPNFASLLESTSKGIFGFGIDLFNLTNPESQEFRKISTDFIKEAKDVFGSRLTDTDVRTYLLTVPTLSQDNEGKIRVIRNLENFNDAAKIKRQIMDQIIEANSGIRPRNLESLVEKRAATDPRLDALAKEFVEGSQQKVVGTQTLAGSVARVPLRAAGII